MKPYEYKYTKENGYKRVYPSRRLIKQTLPNRTLHWTKSLHFLVSDSEIVIETHLSYKAAVLNFLLFPVAIFIYGLSRTKEVWKDTMETLPCNAKKVGCFSVDCIKRGSGEYSLFLFRLSLEGGWEG